MLPDRVSNPGPLTYESGALPIALRGPADRHVNQALFTRPGQQPRPLHLFSTPEHFSYGHKTLKLRCFNIACLLFNTSS